MNSIICQIKLYTRTPDKAIMLSQPLMKQWGCNHNQSVEVKVGNKSLIARVVPVKSKDLKIIISPTMFRQLNLPFTGKTRATFKNKCLRLGPVIGILTTGFTGNATAPFGQRSLLFRSFIQAGEPEHPLIYVFTPEMIDWQSKTIMAWYYKNIGGNQFRWVKAKSPFPDVIYERVPNRKAEQLTSVKNTVSRLKQDTPCLIFNQGFFNKWSIHQLLNDHPLTATFIPETDLSPTLTRLQQMLDQHQMIYLKPSGGSLGLGIYRITQHPKEGYFCRFHNNEKNVLHRFYSLERLIKHYFGSIQSERFKKYLAQQGIRLIKHGGRPVDFRVHLHKDSKKQWKVVAIGSKAAGNGSITTHIRTGGSIIPTDQLLKKVFKEEAEEVKEAISASSILMAQVLEQQIDGLLGELGLDIGVDHNKNIWLFEINAKPGRHIFHHPSLREAGRQSAKYITDYSLSLADFL